MAQRNRRRMMPSRCTPSRPKRLNLTMPLFRLAFAAGQRARLGRRSPYAAAARAADVSGLPPIYISVGALDLFLEENMIYADRLSRAGVPVELHMYPRAYHGFYRVTNARVL
jgi:acetyl esterase/lipase